MVNRDQTESKAEKFARLRKEYGSSDALDPAKVDVDPIKQFSHWFEVAVAAGLSEPNAMALSTVDSNGKPSSRMVLLKGFDENGFIFYTNYLSRKGRQLSSRPDAALLFYWNEFDRQVRIEGTVSKVSAELSNQYFASRPRNAQLGALVSAQSERIESRKDLEERYKALDSKLSQGTIARPEHWGGFVLRPSYFEFWQGREGRLHDRVEYRQLRNQWQLNRLSP